MRGKFIFEKRKSGKLIETVEGPNVITDDGRELLYDYLSKQVPNFIEYVGVGISETAATTSDTELSHEIFRKNVESVSRDVSNTKVSYHINLPPGVALGEISEFGVFEGTKERNDILIASFDLDEETWDVGSADTANFKLGEESLKVTATQGTTTTTRLEEEWDMSTFFDADRFSMMIYPSDTANLTSIELRFETDVSNYFSTTFSSGFSNDAWTEHSTNRENFTETGTPDWENIDSIALIITLSAGSNVDVNFDSLRLITDSEIRMFARKTITPTSKEEADEIVVIYELEI